MASRVNINKSEAMKRADEMGISVGKMKTINGVKSIQVGTRLVYYDPSTGGCACWCVSGHKNSRGKEIVGYIGEAIIYAVNNQ